jgi:hypothetical protein
LTHTYEAEYGERVRTCPAEKSKEIGEILGDRERHGMVAGNRWAECASATLTIPA